MFNFGGRVNSTNLENHFVVITGQKAPFWYIIYPGVKIFEIWPEISLIFGRVTSDDLGNHFLVITGPRAVFWYIICPGLTIFVFLPQMTQTFCDLIPFHYQNGVKIFLDYNKNKSIEFPAFLAYFYR